MKQANITYAAAAAVLLVSGCSAGVLRAPDPQARSGCEAQSVTADLRAVTSLALLEVRPKYIVDTCSGTSQVSGTKFVLRGSDETKRLLACPNVRVHVGAEGEIAAESGSPWLPEGWLEIDVTPEAEGVAVTLASDTVSKNVKLFRHAAASVASLSVTPTTAPPR
jgi:hypothetical protein